jgi:hypothetical protein
MLIQQQLRCNTYGVDKREGRSIYYKAISPTDFGSRLIASFAHAYFFSSSRRFDSFVATK